MIYTFVQETWIIRDRTAKGKTIGRGKLLTKFQTVRKNLIKSGAIKVLLKKSEDDNSEYIDYDEGKFLKVCDNLDIS